MNAQSFTVVATVQAEPGKETLLRQELLALIGTTRREAGCLNYDLHQAVDDPARFLCHETRTSKKHLDDHSARPHLQAFPAKAGDLPAGRPEFTLWEKLA